MNIGDLFFGIHGDTKQLEVDARKAGEAAGAAAGLAASQSLGAQFKRGLPGALSSFGTGILQGMGQEAWRGISGAVGSAVSAIPDLIERGKQYGLLIDDIADKTGATAERSSILAGSLMTLGISADGLGTNLRVLSKEIADNEGGFRKLGIATRDANGVQLDTVTILDNVRRYLSGTADGADKLAIASKLLGKSAGDLIDYLNLTDAQAAALESRLRSLGLIVGEEFRTESEKAKRASAELDLAFLGLGVTLQAEVGPTIRAVVSGITQFIVDHAAEIRDALATVASAIAGLVAGLVGIDVGTSFIDQLSALGGAPLTATDKLNSELADLTSQRAELVAQQPKVTGGANAETAALDRQTAAIEKQVAALDRKETAEERVFQRTIDRLAAVYQAQLDAMDAEERAARLAEERRDAAVSVAEAEAALAAERRKAGTDEYDPARVADAELAVVAARQRQAALSVQQERDERRRRLEETRAYIESIADLEANAENRKALSTTLANRRKALEDKLAVAQTAGDTEEVARLTSKLEAVKTAETRNAAAMRNETRKTELQRAKDELAELRKAITSSVGGGVTEAEKTWRAKMTEIDGRIAEVRGSLQSLYQANVMSRTLMGAGGGGKPPLGSGGGISDAWAQTAADWKTHGEEIRKAILGDGSPGSGIVGAIQSIGQAIYDLTHIELPEWLRQILTMGDLGPARTPLFIPKPGGGYRIEMPNESGGAFATGGVIPPGGWGWVGEAGMERAYSLPGGGTVIEPIASSPGAAHVIHTHVHLREREIAEAIDEFLPFR